MPTPPSPAWLRRPAAARALRLAAGVLAAFVALIVMAAPASAHAVLVDSDPHDGANLAAAPAQVSVTFDEAVGLRPGYLQVIDGTGRRVDTGTAFHPDGHDDVVTVRLRAGLGRAAYVASYRVISADSHPVGGAIEFTVGGAAPTTIRPGERSTDALVSALFDAARTVTFTGLALFGGAWLLLLARHRRGSDRRAQPPRWWRSVRWGAIVALGGLAAEFVLQGPYAAGERITAVSRAGLLGDTMSSAFGRWHVTAIVLLAGLTVAAFGLPRSGRRGRELVAIAAVAWIAVLTAVAESGHAGVRSPVWLGLPVTVAHLLAMSTWIGGLTVLAMVVLPLAAHPEDIALAGRVLPPFSRVAMASVATLAATGTYQAWQEVGSWSALFDTTYGELVLTKIELFAVLVALGALARARVAAWPAGPGPGSGSGSGSGEPSARRRITGAAAQLRTGVVLELGVAFAVLCVSGVLVAQPPGRDAAVSAQATGRAVVTAPLSATRTVTVRVDPARHGPVTVEVDVSPGPSVEHITVAATQNAAGVGPLPVAVRLVDTGVYRSLPTNLPVAGDWQFSITVQTSEFDIVTATPTLHLD